MDEGKYRALLVRNWNEQFFDDGSGNWRDNWFVDGLRSEIRNTPGGMVFAAGPVAMDHGSHSVIWTKKDFAGDIRIEFDYTRLDTITRFVNILYIQATGRQEGAFTEDISDWAELRTVPFMKSYFKTMELLHVSYAAFDNNDDKAEDYVRARRYPTGADRAFNQTDVPPDYFDTGLFVTGVKYHFTFIKTDDCLFFEVKNDETRRLFGWPLGDVEPLTHGRVGIRHMCTRCSRYANVRISTL